MLLVELLRIMPKDKLELFKLEYRLSKLEDKFRFYEEKLQFLDLLDIEINREQVKKHLKYLNYKVKEQNKIYLNFCYHPTDPRQKEDPGVKSSRFNWEKIEKQQSKGRNVYVVVNGHKGGYDEEDINKSVGIFFEVNNIFVKNQQQKWQEVGFLEPTFSVYNSERSLGSYWIFNEPLKDKKQWYNLQQNLLKLMKIESRVVNASQSFCLAGCWHIEPNKKPTLIEICQESGQKYDVHELQSKLENFLV